MKQNLLVHHQKVQFSQKNAYKNKKYKEEKTEAVLFIII